MCTTDSHCHMQSVGFSFKNRRTVRAHLIKEVVILPYSRNIQVSRGHPVVLSN